MSIRAMVMETWDDCLLRDVPNALTTLESAQSRASFTPYYMLVPGMVLSRYMEKARKITVEIPPELLDKAQKASGAGITQTVRTGLQLVAASQTYEKLLKLRGKARFSRTFADLKIDR